MAQHITRTILEGFNQHYFLFREITTHAKRRFQCAD
jgi:isocitrate dehydrogenase kinase/phosphatase